jgi:hypothetical protein
MSGIVTWREAPELKPERRLGKIVETQKTIEAWRITGDKLVGSIKGSRVIVFNFAEKPMDVACCGTDSSFPEPVGDLGKRPAFAAQFANCGSVCFEFAAARLGRSGLRLGQQ